MAAGSAARGGLFGRLYRGESNVDFIGSRKKWYLASAIIILICVLSMIFRQFNFGVEFVGGTEFRVPVVAGTTLDDVRQAAAGAGADVSSAVKAGSASSTTYVIDTSKLAPADFEKVRAAISTAAKVSEDQVPYSSVSGSWGGVVTQQAIEALIVFLVAVSAYISVRFRDWRMALAAVGALFHDLILTAGVYSLIGFEVTPGTIVGLLTILGFSLYDTVVVFDKVDENSRGILAGSRYTYAETANMAVNQTLMRSINTSIIGLLPVAGLLFVGAGLLGVGTLEDLALVLFVGMLTGAYSSLFLATPWLVDLKQLDPKYKNHAQRILARRASAAAKAGATDGGPARAVRPAVSADDDDYTDEPVDAFAGAAAPRPGAKPAGKRTAGNRPGARPGGKRH